MKEIIHQELIKHIETSNLMTDLVDRIEAVAHLAIETINNEGKILIFGNGGSAADAQHIAAELVGRFKESRQGLPCIALTTDSSALTAIGNDFGFEFIFQRQLEAIASPNDLVIGISTSGNSINVIRALSYAKQNNLQTVGLSGNDGGEMNSICKTNIVIPSSDTPRIQEMHIFIGHTICHLIDLQFSI